MCSVVDGATLYMNGHITRSVGPREERRVCENKRLDGEAHLLEGSEYMVWDGSYSKETLPTGAGALISSFCSLRKCAEGEYVPLKVLRRAGQVYFLHFPEAGRFDSLCLDIIDKNFVAGAWFSLPTLTDTRTGQLIARRSAQKLVSLHPEQIKKEKRELKCNR